MSQVLEGNPGLTLSVKGARSEARHSPRLQSMPPEPQKAYRTLAGPGASRSALGTEPTENA